MSVDATNKSLGVAVTSGGKFIPITECLDADGESCDPGDAVSVVAGPDENGDWWHLVMSDYDVSVH